MGTGQPDEECNADGTCDSGATCELGFCATIPRCNSKNKQGGNFGETVPIQMGSSSGTGTFSMLTFEAEDQMTLRDQNGNVILKTPCIGTDVVNDLFQNCDGSNVDIDKKCYSGFFECDFSQGIFSRTCSFSDGWTCDIDTGWCEQPFTYSGGSTLSVEVEPNCADSINTLWEFVVECR